MVETLIRAALTQRAAVLIATLVVIVAGIFSFIRMPIDAFPDVTNIQVQILAEAPGMVPLDVERQITFPVEIEMNGIARVTQVRSISKFGLAVVTVVFEDGVDVYFARQQVAERLALVTKALPLGTEAALGPIATGMGEIYQYTLEGPYDLMTRRTIQDWLIRPYLRTVSGVTEVNTLGGLLKQHQVAVRPDRLAAYGLTVQDVIAALGRSNRNAAGNYFDKGNEQLLVRGLGMLDGPSQLPTVLVAVRDGRPVFLRDLATNRTIVRHCTSIPAGLMCNNMPYGSTLIGNQFFALVGLRQVRVWCFCMCQSGFEHKPMRHCLDKVLTSHPCITVHCRLLAQVAKCGCAARFQGVG